MRRLALAEELLRDSSFLFWDELTSGLDPHAERALMQWLADLTQETWNTIVIVTHAIANLHVCDQVMLLNQGRVLYAGMPDQMLRYFSQPVLEDVCQYGADDSPMDTPALNQRQPLPSDSVASYRPAAFIVQHMAVISCQVKLLWRDRGQLWLQVQLMISFPLLVAIIAPEGTTGGEALLAASADQRHRKPRRAHPVHLGILSRFVLGGGAEHVPGYPAHPDGANNAAREIAKEQQVLFKELRASLSPLAYLLTKVGQIILFSLLQAGLITGRPLHQVPSCQMTARAETSLWGSLLLVMKEGGDQLLLPEGRLQGGAYRSIGRPALTL